MTEKGQQFKYNDKEQRLMDAVSERRNKLHLFYFGSGHKSGWNHSVLAVDKDPITNEPKVVGKIGWTYEDGIDGLGVHPDYRNSGVTMALIQAATAIAHKQGGGSITPNQSVDLSMDSAKLLNKITGQNRQTEKAYDFMGNTVKRYANQLGVLTAGPHLNGSCPVHEVNNGTPCKTCGGTNPEYGSLGTKTLKQILMWE
jgi:GNAT superfamily N-acetyltransferase